MIDVQNESHAWLEAIKVDSEKYLYMILESATSRRESQNTLLLDRLDHLVRIL